MKRIRFTADAEYKCIPGPVFYRAGSVHELRDDLAARWVRRGVAVELPPAPFPLVTALDFAVLTGVPKDWAQAEIDALATEPDSDPIESPIEIDPTKFLESARFTAKHQPEPEPDPDESPFIPTEPRRRGRPPKRLA